MITPASIGDWAMDVGLLGMLSGFAALVYRSIARSIEPGIQAGSGPILFPHPVEQH